MAIIYLRGTMMARIIGGDIDPDTVNMNVYITGGGTTTKFPKKWI